MLNTFRRTATAVAALAVIGGAGVGIAGATTPGIAGPVAAVAHKCQSASRNPNIIIPEAARGAQDDCVRIAPR